MLVERETDDRCGEINGLNSMSYMSKFVAALVGLLLLALLVSWELFLFAVNRDPSGVSTSAGRSHLWLALGAVITACIAGSLMFRFFGLHEKMKWSKSN
jgi:hypothetical protein